MNRPLRSAVASAVLAALLLGCSPEATERELLSSARTSLAKSDHDAARLNVQNALQKNPSSSEARYLMGRVLFETGQIAAAEIELRKALELKHTDTEVVPALARVMLLRQQDAKLLEQYGKTNLPDAQADADLKASVATALARTGNRDGAIALADAVLARTPDAPPMLLAKARVVAATTGVDSALALVDRVVKSQPRSAEAWQLHGELLAFGKRDFAAAIDSYTKSLAIQPANVWAQSALIALHLARIDVPAARKQQQAMARALPTLAQTRYAETQVAFADNNFQLARDLIQPLLKAAPKDARLMHLAGSIEAGLNSPVQAEAYLSKALANAPDLAPARRLLAQTYLRMGQEAKTLETLRPLVSGNSQDVDALILAAEAMLASGNSREAELLFNRAAKLRPDDAKVRTSLALTLVAKGRSDEGFSELRRIAADDKDVVADLALVSALLRQNDLDGALKAIDILGAKEPKNPRTPHMRGKVLLAKRDMAGARKSFDAALALDPAYFPAIASLAAMELVDGKPDAAKQRLEAVLKADPRHLQAMMSLAELAIKRQAGPQEAAEWLDKAVAAHATEPAPRLMLVDLWLANGDRKRALTIAQGGVAVLPDHPAMVDALGRAQLATGEVNQAVATFAKMSTLQPTAALPLLRLADAYRAARNDASAEQSLKRALAVSPRNLDAQRGLIVMALRGKRLKDALQVARQVQEERPTEPIGYLLEGNIHAETKNVDEAVKAYRRGLDKPKAQLLAIQLHTVLTKQKREAEAEQFAAEWLKRQPADAFFLFHLGNTALSAKNWAGAEKYYGQVVQIDAGNAKALNNIAWLKVKTRQPGAVAVAEKAVALAPNNPSMLDTLAAALDQEGQRDRAAAVALSALNLSPNNPSLKLGLARIYVGSGDKAKARELLDALVKLGDKFDQQPEVQALLKQI